MKMKTYIDKFGHSGVSQAESYSNDNMRRSLYRSFGFGLDDNKNLNVYMKRIVNLESPKDENDAISKKYLLKIQNEIKSEIDQFKEMQNKIKTDIQQLKDALDVMSQNHTELMFKYIDDRIAFVSKDMLQEINKKFMNIEDLLFKVVTKQQNFDDSPKIEKIVHPIIKG